MSDESQSDHGQTPSSNQPPHQRSPSEQNVQSPPQNQPQGQAELYQTTGKNQSLIETLSQSFEPIRGVLFGAVFYVFSYLGIFALIIMDSGADVESAMSEAGTSSMNVIGWIFYGAHYVPIGVSSGSTTRSENLLSVSELAIPKPFYFAVPIISLFVGGYLIAKLSQNTSKEGRAIAGASIVAGYLPLMFIGCYTFTTTAERQGFNLVYSLDTGSAVISGALMAVILGGIGGYTAR